MHKVPNLCPATDDHPVIYVGTLMHKIWQLIVHYQIPFNVMALSARSITRSTRMPSCPSVRGVIPERMHATKWLHSSRKGSLLLTIIFLMYVGAAPSSTGGGMKITTLTAVIAIVKSKVRNQKKVTYLGKKIPTDRLEMAVSTFIFYTAILFFSVFLKS